MYLLNMLLVTTLYLLQAIRGDINELPVFQGHGYEDPMVPYKWGQMTNSTLSKIMKNIQFKSYHMMHSSCDEVSIINYVFVMILSVYI